MFLRGMGCCGEVLDLKTFLLPDNINIAEDQLLTFVKDLKPTLIVLSICYSDKLIVKTILEKAVLTERRLERNFFGATNGNATVNSENSILQKSHIFKKYIIVV